MENRPTHEQFEQKVKELEGESPQRKQVEEALRESEEKYRAILENIEDGYYEVDLAGNLTFFNDSFCRIVGYSEDELMAGNYWQFTDPEATEEVKQAFSEIYTSGKPIKAFDWEIITKEGTKKNIEASISLIKDSKGHRVGFRGIIRDISDRKQAEEALWEKTRLNQILLDALPCVALLLQRDRQVIISNKVGQDAGAVAGKPCFATWGQYDDPCPWCLAPKALMSGEDQHLEVEALGSIWDAHWVPIGPDLCLCYAFDVTEKRQMEAQIGQVQRMESLGVLADAIANNFNNLLMGIGGNASLMLFDKDPGDPDCKKLRNIEHLVQDGAEMTKQLLSFARSEQWEARPTDLNDLVKETSEMFGSAKKENILLVDDDEVIIDVDRELLQKMGYKVCGAKSGKEGIEIYKADKDKIDLVILDMIMPEIGGRETFDRLKEINADVKVLLSSGYSIDGQAREILERGCDGFIQKPFNVRDLLAKIRGILDKNTLEFIN